MAGKMRYEQTNRKVKVLDKNDLNISYGWKTLINKYPTKCCVCKKYIGNGVKILWHVNQKLVMHKNDCSFIEVVVIDNEGFICYNN